MNHEATNLALMEHVSRHGVWEPCLERFDFGLSLKMSEKTNLSVQRGATLGLATVARSFPTKGAGTGRTPGNLLGL